MHDELTERLRSGARRLLEEAIAVELEEFLSLMSDRRDPRGRAAVVRNGFQPAREILTGIGPVAVNRPGAQSRQRSGVVSVEARATVCAADPFTRCRAAVLYKSRDTVLHNASVCAIRLAICFVL